MSVKSCILVSRWATLVYGDFAPTPYALRSWILKGKIDPAPEKIHGKWFVHPTARYKENGGDASGPGSAAEYQ